MQRGVDLLPIRTFIPRRKLVAITMLLAVLALACNFPTVVQRRQELQEQQFRETLAAEIQQLTGMAQGLPANPAGTPQPIATGESSQPVPSPGGSDPGPVLEQAPAVYAYTARSGDTLDALAARFGVEPEQIGSAEPLPQEGFLPEGQVLSIPNVLGEGPYPGVVLPDGEVIYSFTSAGFEIESFVVGAGGFLASYVEEVDGELLTGAEIVARVAGELSVNPRLLLAFLEYRSGWVYGQPANPGDPRNPIGFYVPGMSGLYDELTFSATQVNIGYYGWRLGTLTQIKFQDDRYARLNPTLNAGSVAVHQLFARLYPQSAWFEALYGQEGFTAQYARLFGDPWEQSAQLGAIFPAGVTQPALELPFRPGEPWSFTGGPHRSWNTGTPPGAIDFSPVTGQPPCVDSQAWVAASAPGLVTRSAENLVVLDLDGDGFEGTGWVLLYLHIADLDRISAGTYVEQDALLGHPSCEGGSATGTHVHMARKFNGEWLPADGAILFVLSGWEVEMGARSYEGFLRKGAEVVAANPGGSSSSVIQR